MTESQLKTLQTLINCPTISPEGNELVLAKQIYNLLQSRNYNPIIQQISPKRGNIVCSIGEGDEYQLTLAGHLDVVAEGDGWTYPAFNATIKDGYLYGRGSSDMKGGIFAMLEAFLSIKEVPKKGKITLLFVADEEANNLGINYFLADDFTKCKENYAVIGEPTNLEICNCHLGAQRYWITCHGKTAHSSKPSNGINAILDAAKLINNFELYNDYLKKHERNNCTPSCAITIIKGGEKHNMIPDSCSFYIDRRTVPGETKESIDNEIEQIIKKTEGLRSKVELKNCFDFDSGFLDKNDTFVGLACELTNRKPTIFKAGCEQNLMIQGGYKTIICGPGSLEEAHTPDEKCPLSEIEDSIYLYRNLINTLIKEKERAK